MKKTILMAMVLLLGWGVMAQGEPVSWKKNLTINTEGLVVNVEGFCGYVSIWQDTADYIEVTWCDAADTARLHQGGLYTLHPLGKSYTSLILQAFSGYGSICVHTTKKILSVGVNGICRVDLFPAHQKDSAFEKLTVAAGQQSLVNVMSSFKCNGLVELEAKDNAIISYISYEAKKKQEHTSQHGLIQRAH